jgi:hypothetical protein
MSNFKMSTENFSEPLGSPERASEWLCFPWEYHEWALLHNRFTVPPPSEVLPILPNIVEINKV